MNISDIVPWKAGRGSEITGRTEEEPFGALRREFDRFFENFGSLAPWTLEEGYGTFAPRVNVTEKGDTIEVTAELPGMEQKDIDVSLTRDILTIKGEKKREHEEREGSAYRSERIYGSFCRTIQLPNADLRLEEVEANFKNGVLTITLPKKEESQQISKRIRVRSS